MTDFEVISTASKQRSFLLNTLYRQHLCLLLTNVVTHVLGD